MNHHLSLPTWVSVLAGIALMTSVAACGSGNDNSTPTTNAPQTQTATQTVTQTAGTQPGGATTTTNRGQKEAVVNGKTQTLTSGPLTLSVKVDKLIDPLKTFIDVPQKGNKLVGVFLTGKTSGKFQPVDTAATALLKTDKGNASVVRVISDGDCSGAFFPGGILDERTDQSGCVGFEIPKNATPRAITIGIQTRGDKPAEGTWDLPKAQ